jgi:hypothetical protein
VGYVASGMDHGLTLIEISLTAWAGLLSYDTP